jgi:hypothetical protein
LGSFFFMNVVSLLLYGESWYSASLIISGYKSRNKNISLKQIPKWNTVKH